MSEDPRRSLPSVSVLLDHDRVATLLRIHPRSLVMEAIREGLDRVRSSIEAGTPTVELERVLSGVEETLRRMEITRLRPVVNATGILLHTNLGRAVLPDRAARALGSLDRCCNLQIDLETGQRGKRTHRTEALLTQITGAEAALVVNNNAAATLLVLSVLCQGREVLVSRGQLIEIGGSFRLPDCVHQSGAVLVEVGTTNKTHRRDYENALSERTAAILRVNPSNYRIVGFVEEVPLRDLVALRKDRPVLVIDDLGAGALVDLETYGLPHEPTVQESLRAGADLVLFSGDKLIGGPQAGIVVGKRDLIARIKKHPLMRMLRVCKLTDMALQETLRLFLDPESLPKWNPTFRMLTIPVDELRRRAEDLRKRAEGLGWEAQVKPTQSELGGGSLPTVPLEGVALALKLSGVSPQRLMELLRLSEPPIVPRIQDDSVLLEMRTLMEGDDESVLEALERLIKGLGRE